MVHPLPRTATHCGIAIARLYFINCKIRIVQIAAEGCQTSYETIGIASTRKSSHLSADNERYYHTPLRNRAVLHEGIDTPIAFIHCKVMLIQCSSHSVTAAVRPQSKCRSLVYHTYFSLKFRLLTVCFSTEW